MEEALERISREMADAVRKRDRETWLALSQEAKKIIEEGEE